VTGKGLGQVRTICSLARLLHPSVLVLEDVDLIFTSREINLYSTALGDMMDELDAFKREESVLFILTTNSIERLEAAIKDRPGRISQCIFFGPPTRDLRIRYLKRYLEAYDTSNLSMEYIADVSDGGSQAFLEELVYRTVQIAAEGNGDKIVLKDEYFKEAVDEMTGHQDQSAGSILGFRFD
jgi:SpoVK/Ycf46/Vps4 family AAA+-type ATPase